MINVTVDETAPSLERERVNILDGHDCHVHLERLDDESFILIVRDDDVLYEIVIESDKKVAALIEVKEEPPQIHP